MKKLYVNPLSAKKVKVRASPSGFAVPYSFSISHTYGFGFFICETIQTQEWKQNFPYKKISFPHCQTTLLKINI